MNEQFSYTVKDDELSWKFRIVGILLSDKTKDQKKK